MSRFTLPDGTAVDVEMTSKVNGPAQPAGLRYGKDYPWYRVNGGEWHQSRHASYNRLVEWTILSESFADFVSGEESAA